ncbi:hypothetical protein Dimus_024140 [Dionaea muscipula]
MGGRRGRPRKVVVARQGDASSMKKDSPAQGKEARRASGVAADLGLRVSTLLEDEGRKEVIDPDLELRLNGFGLGEEIVTDLGHEVVIVAVSPGGLNGPPRVDLNEAHKIAADRYLGNKHCIRCGNLGHRVDECKGPAVKVQKEWRPVLPKAPVQGEDGALGSLDQTSYSQRDLDLGLVSGDRLGASEQWRTVLGRNSGHLPVSPAAGLVPIAQWFAVLGTDEDEGLQSKGVMESDRPASCDRDRHVEHEGHE